MRTRAALDRPRQGALRTVAAQPSDAPAAVDVEHEGIVYRVAIKRVATARRFTLRVRAATQDAVLTMPPRASLRTARAFAERHAAWIGTRLTALPRPLLIGPGAVLPLRGIDHLVVERRGLRAGVFVEPAPGADGEQPRLVVSTTGRRAKGLLETYLRQEAHRDLTAAALKLQDRFGLSFTKITIRETRSRWGSCSSRGSLNFSWRLILAPPFVLDYLVAHEMAHLDHMDHSPAFWALTRRLAPDMERAEAWLKSHGARLHRYAFGDDAGGPAVTAGGER